MRRSLSRFKHVRYRAILHWRWEHTWNRFVETSTGSDSAAFSNLDPWKYTYVSYVSFPFSTPFPFQTCRSLFFFSFLVWRSFGEIKATGRGRKGIVVAWNSMDHARRLCLENSTVRRKRGIERSFRIGVLVSPSLSRNKGTSIGLQNLFIRLYVHHNLSDFAIIFKIEDGILF